MIAISSIFISGAFTSVSTGLAVASESAIFIAPWANKIIAFISISRLGRPINDVQAAIENVGNIEVAKLEKGLTVMATISGGAPMLGFLGTVTGMVRAFYEMANAGSGNIDITLLSGGIYEAMITTVGGLIVGIIAMFAYNYLVMLVDRVVNKMESRTMEFMDLLNEPAQK